MENKLNNGINADEINGIKVEASLSPIEIKADISETINEAYEDGLKPAVQETGKGLAFCFQFLSSLVKPFMYEKIQEADYKCMEIDKKLEEKYSHILPENQTFPRTSILGPSLDVLKYNLDEEHIKEMFINLLSSDMDLSKQNKVLPSYIDIIKQLSKKDAEALKLLKEVLPLALPIPRASAFTLEYKIKITNNSIPASLDTIFFVNSDKYYVIDSLVMDNLIRLNLVRIDFSHLYNPADYDIILEQIKNNNNFSDIDTEHIELTSRKGVLEITNFGKNLIDICLS